nr:hypothetical protein [Mesorhizobium sp.]
MLPIIASIQQSGITSLRGLAIALNNRGVRTARNGQWQVSNVRNIWGGKLLQTCFYRRENALNLKRFPHAHEYSCQVTAIFPTHDWQRAGRDFERNSSRAAAASRPKRPAEGGIFSDYLTGRHNSPRSQHFWRQPCIVPLPITAIERAASGAR